MPYRIVCIVPVCRFCKSRHFIDLYWPYVIHSLQPVTIYRYCVCVVCKYTWTQYDKYKRDCPAGQTCPTIAATTQDDCEAACLGDGGCDGYDWNPTLAVGQRCILSGALPHTIVAGTATGYIHNNLVRTCPGNITNAQRLLVIFGRQRPYPILNWSR